MHQSIVNDICTCLGTGRLDGSSGRGRLARLALLGCFALGSGVAAAAPVLYLNDPVTDRADFQLAAGGGLVLESFEDLFVTGTSLSFPVGGPQAFNVTAGLNMNYMTGLVGRLVTHGLASLSFGENPSTTLEFTFDAPITAFGLDVNDMNFGKMTFFDNLGNVANDVLVGDDCGLAGGPSCMNLQFFGVTNTEAFTSVGLTFTNVSTKTGTLSVDRLEFSPTSVSEPATLALLAFGLAAVGRERRRRAAQRPIA